MATHDKVTDDREPSTVVVRETGRGRFQQEVISGAHRLLADEPVSVGGLDSGPDPYELLLAALGACTSMTLRLYADRKRLPLTRTQVRLRHRRTYAADCAECETKAGMLDRIERVVTLEGDLNAEQRAQLMEIADKCPVHRTLKSEVDIRTIEEPAGDSASCRIYDVPANARDAEWTSNSRLIPRHGRLNVPRETPMSSSKPAAHRGTSDPIGQSKARLLPATPASARNADAELTAFGCVDPEQSNTLAGDFDGVAVDDGDDPDDTILRDRVHGDGQNDQ